MCSPQLVQMRHGNPPEPPALHTCSSGCSSPTGVQPLLSFRCHLTQQPHNPPRPLGALEVTAGPQHKARALRSPRVGSFSHFQPALNSAEAQTVPAAGTEPQPPPLLSIWAGAVLGAHSPHPHWVCRLLLVALTSLYQCLQHGKKKNQESLLLVSHTDFPTYFLLITWQEAQSILLAHHRHDQGQYSHMLPASHVPSISLLPSKSPVLQHPHY